MIMIIIYENHNHYHTNHLDKKFRSKVWKFRSDVWLLWRVAMIVITILIILIKKDKKVHYDQMRCLWRGGRGGLPHSGRSRVLQQGVHLGPTSQCQQCKQRIARCYLHLRWYILCVCIMYALCLILCVFVRWVTVVAWPRAPRLFVYLCVFCNSLFCICELVYLCICAMSQRSGRDLWHLAPGVSIRTARAPMCPKF